MRELVNILARATALEEDDFALIMREHKEMNAGLGGMNTPCEPIAAVEQASSPAAEELPVKLEDAIRLHVRRVYGKCGQNLSRAAEALGVSRNTVRQYL